MGKHNGTEAEGQAAELSAREQKIQALFAEYRRIVGPLAPADLEDSLELIPTEIEKKWVVTALPTEISRQTAAGVARSYTRMRQGYTETGVRLREETRYQRIEEGEHMGEYRMVGNAYNVSFKTYLTEDGVDRYEAPAVDIGEKNFREFWGELVEDNYIEKTRFAIHDGHAQFIDLDIYDAYPDLFGELTMLEIEFRTHQNAKDYSLPASFHIPGRIREVTSDNRFDAKTLAEIRGGRRNREGKRRGQAGNGRRK